MSIVGVLNFSANTKMVRSKVGLRMVHNGRSVLRPSDKHGLSLISFSNLL
jgi:hypothetical protein